MMFKQLFNRQEISQGQPSSQRETTFDLKEQSSSEQEFPVLENQAIEDQKLLERQAAEEAYRERLKQGEYLGILESYGIKWDLEKVGRDVLQNFYDASGYSLDGVRFNVEGDEEQGFTLTITGDANYDYRKLLHIGGTGKEDDPMSAGGFGEGAKMLSLALLRDHGVSQVQYGSTGWKLDFYLDEAPAGSYDKSIEGLYAKLSEENPELGNFIRIASRQKVVVEEIVRAKELFYSSENPDFQNPSAEVSTEKGEVFGFKYLGVNEQGKVRRGHFYDAGQRRHYDRDNKGWETVPGVHLWSKHKVFSGDRDRGMVDKYKVEHGIIEPLVAALPEDQLVGIMQEMESAWPRGTMSFYEASYKLLEGVVNRLKTKGVELQFPEDYLAASPFMPTYIEERLSQNHTLCHSMFAKIGMKGAAERFKEMQEHIKMEPTEEQLRKVYLLQDVVELLQHSFQESEVEKSIANKEVWLYSRENEKSIVQGQYDEAFVWLSEDILNASFAKALATYLHELDHKHGTDQSAEFSYQLTDTLESVLAVLLDDPDKYAWYKRLRDAWEESGSYSVPVAS